MKTLLLTLLILILCWLACQASSMITNKPTKSTIIEEPYFSPTTGQLIISVRAARQPSFVRVNNDNNFDWNNVEVEIDGRWKANVFEIRSNGYVDVSYEDFKDSEGKGIPATERPELMPLTISVDSVHGKATQAFQ